MFKLIIILSIKITAGQTTTVTVPGFETFEQCEAAAKAVTTLEEGYGWGQTKKVIDYNRVQAIYCTKE